MEEASVFAPVGNEEVFDRIEPLDTHGGTSLAYLACINGQQYFMKQLKAEYVSNPRYRIMFMKEFCKGQEINHPNIVSYKETGENADGPYMLMEYVTGDTLAKKLEDEPEYFCNRYNLDKFFTQLLQGLKCLHEHHIVYCDLKPENIMLTRINNDVKILDLGFCETDDYVFTAGLTKSFAAPEQKQTERNKLDVRTDIYAVGRLMEYIEEKTDKRLPVAYRHVMKRCLKEEKAKRYASAEELAKALKRYERFMWIKFSCAFIIIAATLGWCISNGNDMTGKTITMDGLHYTITSEDSATCAVTGRIPDIHRDINTGYINLYMKDNIEVNGKMYRVTEIGNGAFYEDSVSSVDLPATLKKIGENAFYRTSLLASVNIPEGVTELGTKCFYGSGISTARLPKSLRIMGETVFGACGNLKRIVVPEGVKELQLDAFAECEKMESIKLPSTLEIIRRGVFWKCYSLKEITIPASVHTIGEYAFFYCDSLKHVYNYAPEPQNLSVIFKHRDVTVHVPAASVEKYRQAEHWRDLTIVGME